MVSIDSALRALVISQISIFTTLSNRVKPGKILAYQSHITENPLHKHVVTIQEASRRHLIKVSLAYNGFLQLASVTTFTFHFHMQSRTMYQSSQLPQW